jgi:predicted Zn-dependent peptidase
MKRVKTSIAIVLSAAVVLAAAAGWAKEEAPAPGPLKKLSFPKFTEHKLKNGLEVVVVEHHEQPIASIWLALRVGSVHAGEGKASLAEYTAELINKGTGEKDSNELAEWIESKGGQFGASSGDDYSWLTVTILSEHLDTAYEFLSHIVTGATFPENELETARKRLKTALEFELSDPTSMADRHFRSVVYGHHPYAIAPTVETVEGVTRDDVAGFHARNYVANNAVMFVVGDVKSKQVKKAVKKHFGSWAEGTPDQVEYPVPPERTARNVSLYHRPGSVQTNLYVGHTGMRPTDEDWPAVAVGNRILGGGATGRLFLNLREEKGWTYGAYSTFSRAVDVGYFRATANVRSEVTDSALTEMLVELERVVDEPVATDELDDAKSYLVGNFPTTIETPSQIASEIGRAKLLGLDKKHLENYRSPIAKVTVEDVQGVMQAHLHPDRLAIVAVGDAGEVKEKIDPIAAVALYDIEGNPMTMDELAVQGIDFDYDTSALRDVKAVYSVSVQDAMKLGDMETQLKRTEDGFQADMQLTGMISMEEHVTFGSEAFEPLAYQYEMSAMGQTMKAHYTFEGRKATGTIEGGREQTEGPKDVEVELVDGALLSACVEFVIATLPLGETRSYKFPTLDVQSGSLQNVTVTVEGEEDLMVPAGSFATYKVRLKTADGEQLLFVQKDSPHVVIKQEIPAQRLSIVLESIEM